MATETDMSASVEVAPQETSRLIGRRTFLASVAAAGAVAVAGVAKAKPAVLEAGLGASGEEVAGALPAHAQLGKGWITAEAAHLEAGALRMVVEHPKTGRRRLVSICLRAPGSGALCTTAHLDLFLMNNGGGGKPTPDDEVRMVEAVAARLAGVEARLAKSGGLLAQGDRLRTLDPIDHIQIHHIHGHISSHISSHTPSRQVTPVQPG
jgi:hypothetical protein